ncbi:MULTISPECIES: DUF262 domain-containing protein [Kocuria]|uniref:DUF262 domain-containing protein n=1 Tax=Kocuria tytonis TaxID=2054280 RepID=A0A495A672_9MICC|nr:MULTISPECIES: DUF262 domain-containing protein [Kocuria]RKQ35311.1 DUF262 domain-containing protein [Kocuria tytonis]
MTTEQIESSDEDELLTRSLSREEREDLEQKNESPISVTFATQDYPIDGLVKRLEKGSMLIPQFRGNDDRVKTAGFQRGFVWSKGQMDKFIESLLLGYPIPGIFLIKQHEDNRLLILDGQQRLETLRRFYAGVHEGRVFSLSNVGEQFEGLTYNSLDESFKIKLDDSYMQATIVSADGSDEVDDAIYQIFERLNSGGTQLTPHEIRVALYAGNLMSAIERLNEDDNWRSLYGRKSKRIRDHELVMRILALYEESAKYKRPLKQFLNGYAKSHRKQNVDTLRAGHYFIDAALQIETQVGSGAFRRKGGAQVNAAQAEAVMVAVMEAASKGLVPSDLLGKITALQSDQEFIASTTKSTADNDAVQQRLAKAKEYLIDHG